MNRNGTQLRRLATLCAVAGTLTAACGSHPREDAMPHRMSVAATPSARPAVQRLMTSPPPAAASMVCSDELRGKIAQLAGAASVPAGTATWRDGVFRCVYHVADGELTLTVRVASSNAGARSYAARLRPTLGTTQTIGGLASFGLPAYETGTGVVVFVKDADVLVIDGRRLPPATGAARHTRADFAYTVASDVISCWNGD